MQAPQPHQSVQPPRPREAGTWEDRPDNATVRRQGMVVDIDPLVPQPVPDWDWGPEEERRGR